MRPEPDGAACNALLWQPDTLQVSFLVTVVECCACFCAPVPVPLWHVAHLLTEIERPACLMEWQPLHFLKPGLLAWYVWKALALV